MLNDLRASSPASHDRRGLILSLSLSSALAVGMLVSRGWYTGQRTYGFLAWNLFLAWLPLLFILAAFAVRPCGRGRRITIVALLGLWFLFFPNAPYLVTDLLHLRHNPRFDRPLPPALTPFSPGVAAPAWFDAVLFMAFAWNGLLLGFASLAIVHQAVRARLGEAVGWSAVVATLLLGSFGISIGRFQRWNSWDVIRRPVALLTDTTARLLEPWDHPRTTASTFALATFLLLAYVALTALSRIHHVQRVSVSEPSSR